MQSIVDSVFVTVVGLVVTLLAVGLGGIVILLAADGHSPSGRHTPTA